MKSVLLSRFVVGLLATIVVLLVVISVKLFTLSQTPTEQDHEKFPYLSKRIFTENQNDILVNFIPLRNTMREYVSILPDTVGVYFEYLPSGISIGVNDRNELAIASLFKTPLVMAIYRQIEKGVLKKDDIITMTEEHINKGFGDLWTRGVGTTLTIEELINIVLVESDNTASQMLRSKISEDDIEKVFESLDINTESNGKALVISPKSYSSILRSLYLSSYLERDFSNEILDILTKTNYNDKIVAGVPEDIKVAHKIGIWDIDSTNGGGIIYNDCGIFYPPERPYLLCVMVKTDEKKAQEYMNRLSRMVYSYVTKVKNN